MSLYFGGTSLLLHGDGTDGSTVFTDETGKTVTPYGNAHISTAQSKFGGSSMYFDGSGDYLTVASSTDMDFVSLDFTIEMWVKTTQTSNNATLVTREWGGSYSNGWSLQLNNSNGLLTLFAADYSLGAPLITCSDGVHDGAWHHVAWVRSGSVHSIYKDGIRIGTTETTFSFVIRSTPLTIGNDLTFGSGSRAYSGYLDDIRITRGIALYTSDFTPPAAPLTIAPGIQIQIQQHDPGLHKLAKYDPSQVKPVISEVKNDLQDRLPYGTTTGTWEFKGRGVITGTVAEKALPANTPLRRLVRLHREPDGALVQATWSDATTGAYTFNGVRPDRKYFVTSFDYTNTYRAVIADNLSPTAL